MAIYHFATTAQGGNDTTGTGSQAAPFATRAKAQSVSVAGDILRFRRGGTYGAGAGVLTLKNDQIVEDWGAGALPIHTSTGNCFELGATTGVTIRNSVLTQHPGYGIRMQNGGGHTFVGCTFTNYGVSGNAEPRALRMFGTVNNVLVENCVFQLNLGGDHIYGRCNNFTARGCQFNSPGPANGDHIQLADSDNTIIEDCTFSGVTSGKGNLIFVAHEGCNAGQFLGVPQNVTVRRCHFDGGNFAIASNATVIHVYECTFDSCGNRPGNATWGCAIWMSVDPCVADTGLMHWNVHNNIFTNCRFAVHSFPPAGQVVTRRWRLDFYDNTVCSGGPDRWMSLNNGIFSGDVSNNIIKDSIVAGANSTAQFTGFSKHDNFYQNTDSRFLVNGVFQNETGQITGNAQLVNCCPASGSPAINYGATQLCTPESTNINVQGGPSAQSASLSGSLTVSGVPVVASEDMLFVFRPQDYEPTATTATFSTRNLHPVLEFQGVTADQEAVFSGVMPTWYDGNGITVEIQVGLASATTGTMRWQGAFERIQAGTLDIDADSFASFNSAGQSAPGTSGVFVWVTLTFLNSEIDGLQAGDAFRFKLRRDQDGTSGTDDITTIAQFRMGKMKET